MKHKLIGLTGSARSGKSTIAGILKQQGFVELAFANPIKYFVAELLQYSLKELESKKADLTPLGVTPRVMLQTLGTEWGRTMINPDIWIHVLAARLHGKDAVVVSDVRFDNEADMLRDRGFIIWHVIRSGYAMPSEAWHNHASEQPVTPRPRDRYIYNCGSLENLEQRVNKFLEE